MPQGIVRLGDANTGGGVVTMAGCDSTVLVNGKPIAVALGAVSAHAKHPTSFLQFKSTGIMVNGKPVAVWPSVDSCGHPRTTGSADVIIGGA